MVITPVFNVPKIVNETDEPVLELVKVIPEGIPFEQTILYWLTLHYGRVLAFSLDQRLFLSKNFGRGTIFELTRHFLL